MSNLNYKPMMYNLNKSSFIVAIDKNLKENKFYRAKCIELDKKLSAELMKIERENFLNYQMFLNVKLENSKYAKRKNKLKDNYSQSDQTDDDETDVDIVTLSLRNKKMSTISKISTETKFFKNERQNTFETQLFKPDESFSSVTKLPDIHRNDEAKSRPGVNSQLSFNTLHTKSTNKSHETSAIPDLTLSHSETLQRNKSIRRDKVSAQKINNQHNSKVTLLNIKKKFDVNKFQCSKHYKH